MSPAVTVPMQMILYSQKKEKELDHRNSTLALQERTGWIHQPQQPNNRMNIPNFTSCNSWPAFRFFAAGWLLDLAFASEVTRTLQVTNATARSPFTIMSPHAFCSFFGLRK